jgi:hypothetical protein
MPKESEMSEPVRSITLANPAPVLSTYLVVHHKDNEFEWDITCIEMYADAEKKQLIYDDIRIDELSRDQQERIYAALEIEVAKRRRERGMRRLWNDILADHAAAQLASAKAMEGSRT